MWSIKELLQFKTREPFSVELQAIVLELRHALQEVIECGECDECVKVAKSALDGLNRDMCRDMARDKDGFYSE